MSESEDDVVIEYEDSEVENESDESDESDESENESEESKNEESDPKIVAGVTQYQHMGYTNCLYEDTFAGMGMDSRTRYKMLGVLTTEQAFRKAAKQYIDSEEDLKKILNIGGLCHYVDKIKKFEYINAKAFVIAYYFLNTQEDNKHKKNKIKDDEIQKIVARYIDDDVTILDVVRYIRYIRNL
jgi:hypothetical protein